MMHNAPKFSVIIPLYNKRLYIRRAVDSVLRQTVSDFELIVVDDGSTDGSLDALADIDDQRLRIIRQENRGVGPARNTGMSNAQGLWFAFIDADDLWLPNHLDELTRIIQQYPQPGLVSPRSFWLPDGQRVALDNRHESTIRKVDYFLEASKSIGLNNSSTTAIHRDAYKALGGFINRRAGEDLEYWARIALQFPVTISDRVTAVHYRFTGGAMEQIAKAPRSITSTGVKNLRKLSPSVAMLCDRAEENPELWQEPSIRAYVNSRLECGIHRALYLGDPGCARDLIGLMMPPLNWKQQFYSLALLLPTWLLRGCLASYRSIRGMVK